MSTRIVAVQPHTTPDDPIMSLVLTSDGSAKRITVRGEIDMSNAHLLVELVEHVVGRRPSRLVLDLSEVAFFGAHAIGALFQAQSTATGVGVPMVLDRLSPRVAYVLALSGAVAEFDLLPALDGHDRGRANERQDGHRAVRPLTQARDLADWTGPGKVPTGAGTVVLAMPAETSAAR
jgi:anti-sigma B factor antagonist